MIRVQEIATAVLFNLGEMYARKHSDPELLEAINAVLRVVNMLLINRESNWIVKETSLKVKNGKATLPNDFVKMKRMYATKDGQENLEYTGDFRIVKNTLYIDDTANKMDYYFIIDSVTSMEDEIDLPAIFLQLFIRYATGIIDGSIGKGGLDSLISEEIENIAQSSNYPVIERPMEFWC